MKRNTMIKNIHGYCPHCNADLDGDLVINAFIKQGVPESKAFIYATMYFGWDEHGERNRFNKATALYDLDRDRTTAYKCPDCEKTWKRE